MICLKGAFYWLYGIMTKGNNFTKGNVTDRTYSISGTIASVTITISIGAVRAESVVAVAGAAVIMITDGATERIGRRSSLLGGQSYKIICNRKDYSGKTTAGFPAAGSKNSNGLANIPADMLVKAFIIIVITAVIAAIIIVVRITVIIIIS